MNEFAHKTSRRRIRPRTRQILPANAQRRPMRHLHSHHHHHRLGGGGSAATQDTRRRDRSERIHAVHELHRALANITRTGDEQLRGEAAQIVAETTAQLNGLLAADR